MRRRIGDVVAVGEQNSEWYYWPMMVFGTCVIVCEGKAQ